MDSQDSKKRDRLRRVLVTCKMIYRRTPPYLRFIFWPVKKINLYASYLRLNIWIITGEEITSKQKLTILYAGGHNDYERNFFARLTFNGSYTEDYIRKSWFWKARTIVKKCKSNCSLVIIESPYFFRGLLKKGTGFFVPGWIHGEVSNSLPLKDSVKTDIRRIKKYNLHFELTNDESQFRNFYYNMHLPYISMTFGNEAVIADYDYMKMHFRKGGMYDDLLLIRNDKEYIAGGLLSYKKNVLHLNQIGIKDGNYDYVRNGAIGALFYFPRVLSKERGFQSVSFGGSRAFFKGGVLQFKKKRGMQLTSASDIGFFIMPLDNSVGIKGFLMNNPFIYMDKGKFNGAVFVEKDQLMTREDIEQIHKDYYMGGISRVSIYQFGPVDSKLQGIVSPEFSDYITIYSAESIF
jgi:hypothetical protein